MAYASDRRVSKVEFSADGGGSWQTADLLEPRAGMDTMVRWQGTFTVAAGAKLSLVARDRWSRPAPDPRLQPASAGGRTCVFAVRVALLLLGGCSYLEEARGAAAASVRAAATRVRTRAMFSPMRVRTPTRPPLPTRTAEPADDTDIEQSVADARMALEGVLRSAALPGSDDLLVQSVALAAPTGGEQLPRAAGARSLRQRVSGRIRVIDFQRPQHQALTLAITHGWAAVAPLSTSQVGFTLQRYDVASAQDPDRGDCLIAVFEAE